MLDCFWEGCCTYEFTPELSLQPVPSYLGVFQNNKAFHGSKYADYIFSITGETLYSEKIENETILNMAKKLSEHLEKKYNGELSLEERRDLSRVFTVYGLLGAHLIGWW